MFYAYVGMVLIIMTPQGMKPHKMIGKLAHGAGFPTMERCENYMNKTGYDSIDIIETQIDAVPHQVVVSIMAKCSQEGTEV